MSGRSGIAETTNRLLRQEGPQGRRGSSRFSVGTRDPIWEYLDAADSTDRDRPTRKRVARNDAFHHGKTSPCVPHHILVSLLEIARDGLVGKRLVERKSQPTPAR